jgi:hypothetical protein
VINAETRHLVRQRAKDRCEYCLLAEEWSQISHHIEHIVAKQHGGMDELANLALACHRCNLRKGPNLTGIDPLTGEVAPLFHPRLDHWSDHFRFENVQVEGITATGRATVQVLALNDARRLDLRMELLIRGDFP